jgi:copper chaperone CopZ
MTKILTSAVLALIAVWASQVQGGGAPPPFTLISIEKMHCEGCAKRIGGKLQAVAGVKGIQYDVQKKLFWIHPQEGRQVSPRALWEAVEQAKDRPTLLEGPAGKFNAKPAS